MEREEAQLYLYLREDFGAEADIIFDRRYVIDRRRAQREVNTDRRRENRRAHDISERLAIHGWAMVRPDAGDVSATH